MRSIATTPAWLAIKSTLGANASPREAADTVLRRLEIDTPPVDVAAIGRRLGVHIVERPLAYAGAIDIDDGSQAVITVNSNDHPRRRRFTIAHEIGHLLLHRFQTMHRDTSFAGDRHEIEANNFAASLAMPFWMIEPYVMRKARASSLARIFDVSEAAMRYRIADFLNVPAEDVL